MVIVHTKTSPNGLLFKIEDIFKSYKEIKGYTEDERGMRIKTRMSSAGIDIQAEMIDMSYKSEDDPIFHDLDFSDYRVFAVFYGDRLNIGDLGDEKIEKIIDGRVPVNTVYDVSQSIHHVCYDYTNSDKSDRVVLSMEHPDRLAIMREMRELARYRMELLDK